MANKVATRGAQYLLMGEFVANYNDQMKDTSGAWKSFGSVFGDQGTFEIIALPVGAVVKGGELITEVAGVGPTAYTVQVGTTATPSAFLGPTTVTVAGARTDFIASPIYPVPGDGSNVVMKIASTVANATAGRFRVRIYYTIDNKINEAVTK